MKPRSPRSPIIAYLRKHCRGKKNAIKHKRLARRLNMDARAMRVEVEGFRRRDHLPILSDCVNGYWWSRSANECGEFAESMLDRGHECALTGDALWLAAAELRAASRKRRTK